MLASTVRYDEQVYRPPALAAVIIEYPGARSVFPLMPMLPSARRCDHCWARRTIRTRGPGLNDQPEVQIS